MNERMRGKRKKKEKKKKKEKRSDQPDSSLAHLSSVAMEKERFTARVIAALINGGTISENPQEIETGLSYRAKEFLDNCYRGLEDVIDYHTHLIGTGSCCDSECYVPDRKTIKDHVYGNVLLKASGCSTLTTADDDYVEALKCLVFRKTKHCILAFDRHYKEDGTADLSKTGMYVYYCFSLYSFLISFLFRYTANSWVKKVCDENPDQFIKTCSVSNLSAAWEFFYNLKTLFRSILIVRIAWKSWSFVIKMAVE
jgi:hypothetical protein